MCWRSVDPRIALKLLDHFCSNCHNTCTSGQNICTKSSYEIFFKSTPFWWIISTFFQNLYCFFILETRVWYKFGENKVIYFSWPYIRTYRHFLFWVSEDYKMDIYNNKLSKSIFVTFTVLSIWYMWVSSYTSCYNKAHTYNGNVTK